MLLFGHSTVTHTGQAVQLKVSGKQNRAALRLLASAVWLAIVLRNPCAQRRCVVAVKHVDFQRVRTGNLGFKRGDFIYRKCVDYSYRCDFERYKLFDNGQCDRLSTIPDSTHQLSLFLVSFLLRAYYRAGTFPAAQKDVL